MELDRLNKLSIDEQIKKAKQRAEEFHNSLQRARTQEQEIIENFEKEKLNLDNERQSLEKEKQRWTKSLEENNFAVQELEKQFTSTVEIEQPNAQIAPSEKSPTRRGDGKEEIISLKQELKALKLWKIDAEGNLQFRLEQVSNGSFILVICITQNHDISCDFLRLSAARSKKIN